jgi:cell division protease FtsH
MNKKNKFFKLSTLVVTLSLLMGSAKAFLLESLLVAGVLLGVVGEAAQQIANEQARMNKNNYPVFQADALKKIKGFHSVAGGVPEEVEALKDQIVNGEKYQKMGIPLPKGFLFYGPPGTGKTLLGRALAEELDMVFISVKAPELESKWIGESAKKVKNLYTQAHAQVNQGKKVIIFIDEIDSIAPNRAITGGGYHAQCLTQLLSEIDGLAKSKNIITIGTTNIPTSIDPALLRSGRLEQHIEISLPDTAKRQAILEYYLAQRPHTLKPSEIANIATLIDGASGADIEELINRAAVFTVRNGKETLSNVELQEAIQKKWPSLQMSATSAGHLTTGLV